MPTDLKYTPLDDIPKIVEKCRQGFFNGALNTNPKRKMILRSIGAFLKEQKKGLFAALKEDLNRTEAECIICDFMPSLEAVYETIVKMDKWTAPHYPHLERLWKLETCYTVPEPYGLALVMSPWNYPIQLTFVGLAGAIGAGNTVIIKMSELSPATTAFVTENIAKYVPDDVVGCVNGGATEGAAVLKQRFDVINFTGSPKLGRIVMKAASENLTPCILELGGKSPAVVDETMNLATAARRIMWGRTINAGQTCIAPDYILAKRSIKQNLIEELAKARTCFLGKNVQESRNYCRIINGPNYERIVGMMKGGKIVVGGETDAATRFIAPTVLDNVDLSSPLMTEEIFGPLLPVVPWDTEKECIKFINDRAKPLALYVFSKDKKFVESIEAQTSSGAICVNDVIMHAGPTALPFGGVQESGMGAVHGKHSFDSFTHNKPVMRRLPGFELLNRLRYPPYFPGLYTVFRCYFRTNEGHFCRKAGLGIGAAAVAAFGYRHWKARGKKK